MNVLEISDPASGSSARILPELGFNCFEFRARLGDEAVDVIDAAADFADGRGRPSGHGIPLLFPFPNRIREGRYTWNGRDYHIPPENCSYDGAGNAIHGFCLDRPWRVRSQGTSFAVGEFHLSVDAPDRVAFWPTDFSIEVRYEVKGAVLRADIRIRNPSSSPLPWGFGTHPYFRLPLASRSNPGACLIEAAAHSMWELADCLPTGRIIPPPKDKDLRDGAHFNRLKLDDVYGGLRPTSDIVHHTIIDADAGLQVIQRCPAHFRELVVYTPPERPAICLEPYTCVTDAVNLEARGIDAGWRVLPPGEQFQTAIEIVASDVIV